MMLRFAVLLLGLLGQIAGSTAPRNDLPQPYGTTRDWGQLPAGVKWAAVTAVEPMFVFPHGATVDREGNPWVTDAQGGNGKGHQVFKFSADGRVLMTLGKAGVSGSGPDLFDQPCDVVVASNGDIFVADSHRNGRNKRIVQITQERKFLKEWGRKGSWAGEFSQRDTIALDSRGRLFLAE